MSNLENEHEEYAENKRNWKLVRDLIKGENELKLHDLSSIRQYTLSLNQFNFGKITTYLPYTSQTTTNSDLQRYFTYVERASLFNATKRTLQGMSGMVYSKDSEVDLPSSLEYLEYDCDGSGVGILEQSVEVFDDLMAVGRAGLFVDYPSIDGPITVEQLSTGNIRANIIKYETEDILDWDTIQVGAAKKLSFVKLRERRYERDPSDIFSTIETVQYRVLILNNGIYEQRIYEDDDNYMSITPTNYLSQPFTFIPFYFVGSTDNRPDVDVAPLLELAELNIKHYRNSADYEESTFLVGQPMVAIPGMDQTWIQDNYPDGIIYGSRIVLMLPQGADIKVVQADPNTMAMEGMKSKENQMKMLGARLLTDGGQAETAEAARIRHSSDMSVIKVVVKNMTDAYTSAIMAVQLYNGSVDEFDFHINDDFYVDRYSIQDIKTLVELWQVNGAISEDEVAKKLQESGLRS